MSTLLIVDCWDVAHGLNGGDKMKRIEIHINENIDINMYNVKSLLMVFVIPFLILSLLIGVVMEKSLLLGFFLGLKLAVFVAIVLILAIAIAELGKRRE